MRSDAGFLAEGLRKPVKPSTSYAQILWTTTQGGEPGNGPLPAFAGAISEPQSRSLIRHGKLANAFARRRKDRIGQRRRGRRGSGFAHPSGRLAAFHDVNLDCRRLVHPQHRVIVEIALLDATALQRDLSAERRGEAEDDRALDLRPDGIGIDDGAAIDRADHAPDANRSVLRHLDFGNLRQIAREDELDGDAAADAFGQGLSPAGLLRRKLENGPGARRLV